MTFNRRSFIEKIMGLGASLGMAGSTVAHDLSVATDSNDSKVFVLVHGAWHGGWCWRYVRGILLAQGHRVFTPTLTGLGERSHLLNRDINLSTHKQDLVNLIEYEELENVILVGHSYAGYVVSLAADALRDKVKQIIYLDASMPTEGQPFIPETQHDSLLGAYGDKYVLPIADLNFLGIPEDHEKAGWVLKHMRPHPLGTLFEPVAYENGGATGIPKTFIRASGSPRYGKDDPALKTVEDKPDEWSYEVIETGHDAMVTAPEELSEMLSRIAL